MVTSTSSPHRLQTSHEAYPSRYVCRLLMPPLSYAGSTTHVVPSILRTTMVWYSSPGNDVEHCGPAGGGGCADARNGTRRIAVRRMLNSAVPERNGRRCIAAPLRAAHCLAAGVTIA